MKFVCKITVMFFLIMLVSGCVNKYGLTEEQQIEAVRKYPVAELNITPEDNGWLISSKVAGRILLAPLTLGFSEVLLLTDLEISYKLYSQFLYYNSFFGKPCSAVISSFGAPARIADDGQGGKIYVFERRYTTGGQTMYYNGHPYTTPVVYHRNVKEFYFTAQDVCYKWNTFTE